VCKELCSRFDPPTPPHDLCLMEVVCGGDLTRSLHYKEKVLSVVVEWGYWDEMDRRDNALVLCSNQEWRSEIAPMVSIQFLSALGRGFEFHTGQTLS
jgi:hypothetical protein